jgi:hypothetical protein
VHDERQEAEAEAMRLLKCALVGAAHRCHATHVDLRHRADVRTGPLRHHHMLRNETPQRRHRDHTIAGLERVAEVSRARGLGGRRGNRRRSSGGRRRGRGDYMPLDIRAGDAPPRLSFDLRKLDARLLCHATRQRGCRRAGGRSDPGPRSRGDRRRRVRRRR